MSSWSRIVRRAGFDRNPMRRSSDQIEAVVRLAVLVVFFVVGPLCAWFAVSTAQLRQAHDARAVRYPATAVLTEPAPVASVDGMALSEVYANAAWTGPDSARHRGLVPVAPGSPVGSKVRIWTTAVGELTDAPAGPVRRDFTLVLIVLLAAAVPGAALAVVAVVTRRVFDRRRFVDWELDWLRVEPGWSGRRQV